MCRQIMENAEINNIIKIVGLQYKKSYEDPESLKSLRYGKIMIMTDQVSPSEQGPSLLYRHAGFIGSESELID